MVHYALQKQTIRALSSRLQAGSSSSNWSSGVFDYDKGKVPINLISPDLSDPIPPMAVRPKDVQECPSASPRGQASTVNRQLLGYQRLCRQIFHLPVNGDPFWCSGKWAKTIEVELYCNGGEHVLH
jgi:hypothetical protein